MISKTKKIVQRICKQLVILKTSKTLDRTFMQNHIEKLVLS